MAVVYPSIVPAITGDKAEKFIAKADLVSKYSKKIMRDKYNKIDTALFDLVESNFLKQEEAKILIRMEKQGEYEYLVFEDKRVWQIRTVYEDTKVYNESKWII
jgi:hypothetical protein